MGKQYDDFLTIENFILAYQRLKTMHRNEYKNFYRLDFHAFEAYFDQNIHNLRDEVENNIYEPSSCEVYYMPKKKNLARPISLLSLLDQIVYQALANIVADEYYDRMKRYFNTNIFGDIFIPTGKENSVFFFENWKNNWKNFSKKQRESYKQGYEYSASFDIASFFDLIDHNILVSVLKNDNIDENIIALLKKCLDKWTISSSSEFSFAKSSGIPQGPIASSFFAELYLLGLDDRIRKIEGIKYFRYVDDICIMAKDEKRCQMMIAYLDLLARDLSLIPQSEKVGVIHIDDINKYLNGYSNKFSMINREYTDHRKLKTATHNQLKRAFVRTIEDGIYDKTIIRFSLYKFNEDDEIRDIILSHMGSMELFYQDILYYFNAHYSNDVDLKKYVEKYLKGESLLFQYNKAVFFSRYNNLPYDEEVFSINCGSEKRFWIIQYAMINWLKKHHREELIVEFYRGNNYFVNQKIEFIKCEQRKDPATRRFILLKLIESKYAMISIYGCYLWLKYMKEYLPTVECHNGYSTKITLGISPDYFVHIMEIRYEIHVPNPILLLLGNSDRYRALQENLRRHINNIEVDPSVSIMALDSFHHILLDQMSKKIGIKIDRYGNELICIRYKLPITFDAFNKVHQIRNQRTYAHYKDKQGRISSHLKIGEYKKILIDLNLKEAYCELFGI
jgi:hypothetical protein